MTSSLLLECAAKCLATPPVYQHYNPRQEWTPEARIDSPGAEEGEEEAIEEGRAEEEAWEEEEEKEGDEEKEGEGEEEEEAGEGDVQDEAQDLDQIWTQGLQFSCQWLWIFLSLCRLQVTLCLVSLHLSLAQSPSLVSFRRLLLHFHRAQFLRLNSFRHFCLHLPLVHSPRLDSFFRHLRSRLRLPRLMMLSVHLPDLLALPVIPGPVPVLRSQHLRRTRSHPIFLLSAHAPALLDH